MSLRPLHALAYRAIRIEGGLLPAEELTRLTLLAEPQATGQTEADYLLPRGLKLRDEIARDFKIALALWRDFQALRQRDDIAPHGITVSQWLLPLLRDVLHFGDMAPCPDLQRDGHSANGGRVPLVLAGFDQPLDAASEHCADTRPDTGTHRRRSPFMLAQEALNASDDMLWAIVSNGLTLRILRDNPSLTRPAYIEVDLQALFGEELLADFSAFWLLAHASRFPAADRPGHHHQAAPPADCHWERWRSAAQQTGITVRGKLRYQVAEALRALGTGFLSHPANASLRQQLQHPEQSGSARQAFFEQLLRLVYRLIFLATVEDRRDPATGAPLVFAPDASAAARERYLGGYSLTWLRQRAVRRSQHDRHGDLWQALGISLRALARGEPALGLPALGGLFAADQCPLLDAAQLSNRHLLAAVFQLGWFRAEGGLSRVNYRDMGPEELGSVYESLLELVPDLQALHSPAHARLAFVGDDEDAASARGNARKLSGSYYTPDSLVQELIRSALDPVIARTVQAHPADPVGALLSLTVCDPACGSGHFLLAAARRLADAVALHRAAAEREGGAPTPADYRLALRDVVGRCIYGVDKNPMAIQLAKTALWLEAYTPERPLTFIDHHLQVGDALLGVLDPKVLENGIPDEAYACLSGDDKAVAAALKKRNRADLKSWRQIAASDLFADAHLARQASALEHLADDTLAGIAAKRSAWQQASEEAAHSTLARLADTYVAAFLAPKIAGAEASTPLSGHLWALLHPQPGHAPQAGVGEAAQRLCRAHGVFHWWLAFPQIAAQGGFGVLLANPPWERIKLQEEEFFANRSPLVAAARNKAERGERIALLQRGLLLHTHAPEVAAAEGLQPPNRAEIQLHQDFIAARRGAEAASLYAHHSGRYPLTGVGDVNTYALFAESLLQLTTAQGRAGFIVPTGIATDDSTKAYFGHIAQSGRLVSLYDFENREAVFPAIDSRIKFSLLTLGAAEAAQFVCFATQVGQLADPRRRFTLTPEEFALINPNTRTCPVFRSKADAELTKKLYRAAPVLIREAAWVGEGKDAHCTAPEANPWGITFQRMLDMSNDSHLFADSPAEANASAPASRRLPLYEAKMVHQFDHRWATYVNNPDKPGGLDTEDVSPAQKADPRFTVRPRYWVDEREVLARIARVPSRMANAWLAWHQASDAARHNASASAERQALQERHSALTLALATWVAGVLWRTEAERLHASHPAPAPSAAPATANLFAEYEQNRPPAPVQQAQAAINKEVEAHAAHWSSITVLRATEATERLLARHHPLLADALKADGTVGKKALPLFQKWALQDDPRQGLGLGSDELAQLQALQTPGTTHLALEWLDAWMDRRSPRWLMGWRDITNATNERTVIASVVPRVGVGNKIPLFFPAPNISPAQAAALLGNLSSLALDFVARQKIGGTTLNYFYMKQFPVLPPDRYTPADLAYIVPRVLELTHTAHDMQAWADDLLAALPSADPRAPAQRCSPLPPFPWNPQRRAQLRAELDAYYARLYGLTRDELRYILDPADVLGADYPSETFRVLKNSELREFGEYRTQRLVLAAWDRLAGAAPSAPSAHG